MLALAGDTNLPFDAGVVPAHGFRDLGQVADAPGGDDRAGAAPRAWQGRPCRVRGDAHVRGRKRPGVPIHQTPLFQDGHQAVVERGHPVVVEA